MRPAFHLVLACAAAVAVTAAPSRAQAPASNAPPAGLRTFVVIGEDDPKEMFILDRRDKEIVYRSPNSPPGVTAGLAIDRIREAEFAVRYDEAAVYARVRTNQWLQASQIILTAISTTLPYLDLPNNNAMEPALQAALYMFRAGDQALRGGATNAPAFFQAAQRVYAAAGRAEWHPGFESARARVVLCLLRQGKTDEAAKAFAALREPDIGDQAFGTYWLAAGELKFVQGDLHGALDAAVRSTVFENKDIDCFPDALLFEARMYEEVNEWHRARDVNYEVARLFRPPVWSEEARGRLKGIMAGGNSRKGEDANITGVFFGTEENMNQVADDFLKGDATEDLPDPPKTKDQKNAPAATKPAGSPEEATKESP